MVQLTENWYSMIYIDYYIAIFISHPIFARGRYISSLELDVSRGEGQCLWTAKSLLVHVTIEIHEQWSATSSDLIHSMMNKTN